MIPEHGRPDPGNHIVGLTNRNPFNLVQYCLNDPWFGSVRPFMDSVNRHAIFDREEYAVCAYSRHLYRCRWMPADRFPKVTVAALIDTQAPADHAGNDPNAYASFIEGRLGLVSGGPFVLHSRTGAVADTALLIGFMRAVAEYEILAGWRLDGTIVLNGLVMYNHRVAESKYRIEPVG